MAKTRLEGNLSGMKFISSCTLRHEGMTVASLLRHSTHPKVLQRSVRPTAPR
ncbi:predicted protein [Botrytis cinerea T4]|uniref:Uncharacterized protein n=1 Tax=Botryotinia fuckeliana (strain T4) TaxID=999810 RepID=G2Y2Y1_BOTF4|nr:predicted protein [Botrytis cinerea T4]